MIWLIIHLCDANVWIVISYILITRLELKNYKKANDTQSLRKAIAFLNFFYQFNFSKILCGSIINITILVPYSCWENMI